MGYVRGAEYCGWCAGRRAGAASALLGAAERMAGKWQQNWVLLHVYADNFPGLRLYHRNGCAAAGSLDTIMSSVRSLLWTSHASLCGSHSQGRAQVEFMKRLIF